MLCNGASNAEPLNCIYRVLGLIWPLWGVQWCYAMCPGSHKLLLEILGKHSDLWWTSECCCVHDDLHLGSSCSSSGFIIYECSYEVLGVSYAFHMNFWAITKVWTFLHTSESSFPRSALELGAGRYSGILQIGRARVLFRSNPGIKPISLMSPALTDGFFNTSTIWEAYMSHRPVCAC